MESAEVETVSDSKNFEKRFSGAKISDAMRRAALSLIGFYQRRISIWTPPSCRFFPTCSHYTYEAVERFGIFQGAWLGLKRIARCHPFCKGGYDPVPSLLSENAPNDALTGHKLDE